MYKHTKTNIPEENEYPKIVRDKIPQIIKENDGLIADVFVVKDVEEHIDFLKKKIVEEANELCKSISIDHLKEEIVDVLEVVDAICLIGDIDKDDIDKIQNEKRQKRGGFEKGFIMRNKI